MLTLFVGPHYTPLLKLEVNTMSRLFKLFAALAALTITTQATDVTLTYTPVQLKAVKRLVNRMNNDAYVQWLAANPTENTNTFVVPYAPLSYVQTLFSAKLDAIVRQEMKLLSTEVAAEFEAADLSTQDGILTTLGIDRNDD